MKIFLRDTDAHFKDAKIINFDIIRKQCRGEEVPKDILVEYQTVRDNDVVKYPGTEQKAIFQVHLELIKRTFILKTKQ